MKIRSYWFSKDKNFGDLITPLILKHYGFEPVNCPIENSDVLVVGSILQDLRRPFAGVVLGSGLIWDASVDLSSSTVLCLRGHLTKACARIKGDTILADPGLLLAKILPKRTLAKKYVLGLVPHYVDKSHPGIQLLLNRYRDDILLIDVQAEPHEVVEQVRQCSYILSSSLHGLIVADSLGIPSKWMLLSQKVIGGGFKFRDYFSSFNEERVPLQLRGSERLSDLITSYKPQLGAIIEKQEQLDACFKRLSFVVSETPV